MLYALDWCVVCTGLAIPVQNTSPVHIPVQFNTPVQYTGIYRSHPLPTPWFATNLTNHPLVYMLKLHGIPCNSAEGRLSPPYIFYIFQNPPPVANLAVNPWYIIHCMCRVVCTRLVCCMREEERGWSSAPAQRGRVVVRSTRHQCTILRIFKFR